LTSTPQKDGKLTHRDKWHGSESPDQLLHILDYNAALHLAFFNCQNGGFVIGKTQR
jgi:hypothetical protein